MITSREILLGILLPAAVAAAVMLAGWIIGRGGRAAPVAVGAGFFAGTYFLFRPGIPPLDSVYWLCFAVPVLTAAALFERLVWIARFMISAALAGLLMWLIARPLFASTWEHSAARGAIWISGVAIVTGVWWKLMDAQARRAGGREIGLGPFLWAALVSATIGYSDSVTMAQIGGALAATLGVVAIFTLLVPKLTSFSGAVFVVAGLAVPLIASSLDEFYSGTSLFHGVLLVLSPLAGWIADVPALRHYSFYARGAVRVLAMIAPALAATSLAYLDFQRASGSSGVTGW